MLSTINIIADIGNYVVCTLLMASGVVGLFLWSKAVSAIAIVLALTGFYYSVCMFLAQPIL